MDLISWKSATEWRWENFTPEEMACHGDGSLRIDESFMDRLQALRDAIGFALPVSSGYRSPAYNATVSDTGDSGPHTTGHAADLLVGGSQAFLVMKTALVLGFTGIGISQRGIYEKRFIHLDDLAHDDLIPRPMVWSY